MSYSITISFDTLGELAAWFKSNGQNVGNPTGASSANANQNAGAVGGSASASAEADPWSDDAPAGNNDPAASSAPSSCGPTTFTVNTDKGVRTWTLNAGNAPACNCGNAAAYQEGTTNGRKWGRWACAKSAPNDNDKQAWKTKCEFSQYG